MTAVIHITGVPAQVGPLLRQRCAWCGAMLLDYDLNRIAVPEGQDPTPATWTPCELLAVDRGASYVVEHKDGDKLPANCCAKLDPEVTR